MPKCGDVPPHSQADNVCGWCRLQSALTLAAEESTSAKGGPSSRHLKPIVHAVEMVFASAAALSAAFGRKVNLLLVSRAYI